MKISHSAVEKYSFCSMQYKLHYIEKLRSTTTSSSFFFGGAIDQGLNELLKSKLLIDPEIFPTPFKAFMENWETVTINDVKHDAKFCPLIEYSKKDLQPELFTEGDLDKVQKFYPDQDPKELIKACVEAREVLPWQSYAKMEQNLKIAYNFLCWVSLARKAEMIFEAYRTEVLPRIKYVHLIQKEVVLENQEGDSVTGFIDFIAEMDDGNVYILDNKTTTDLKYYKDDCIKTSAQLAQYSFAEDIKFAGYIAISKLIKADGRKKGSLPKVKIKIILDTIDEQFQAETLHKYNITNKAIKAQVFEKLSESSKCFQFGKACPFVNYCWGNGNMMGLIKKEEIK